MPGIGYYPRIQSIRAISAGAAIGSQGTVVFSDSNSVSFGMNQNTITASMLGGAGEQTLNWYQPYPDRAAGMLLSSNTVGFHPFTLGGIGESFPGVMTVSSIYINVTLNVSGANSTQCTAAHSATVRIGFYTVTGETYSMINSAQSTWAMGANASNSTFYHGQRVFSFNTSLFSTNLTFSRTQYQVAMLILSSGQSLPINFYNGLESRSHGFGTIGIAGNGSSTRGSMPFKMQYMTTADLPASAAFSVFTTLPSGRGPYGLILNNLISSF